MAALDLLAAAEAACDAESQESQRRQNLLHVNELILQASFADIEGKLGTLKRCISAGCSKHAETGLAAAALQVLGSLLTFPTVRGNESHIASFLPLLAGCLRRRGDTVVLHWALRACQHVPPQALQDPTVVMAAAAVLSSGIDADAPSDRYEVAARVLLLACTDAPLDFRRLAVASGLPALARAAQVAAHSTLLFDASAQLVQVLLDAVLADTHVEPSGEAASAAFLDVCMACLKSPHGSTIERIWTVPASALRTLVACSDEMACLLIGKEGLLLIHHLVDFPLEASVSVASALTSAAQACPMSHMKQSLTEETTAGLLEALAEATARPDVDSSVSEQLAGLMSHVSKVYQAIRQETGPPAPASLSGSPSSHADSASGKEPPCLSPTREVKTAAPVPASSCSADAGSEPAPGTLSSQQLQQSYLQQQSAVRELCELEASTRQARAEKGELEAELTQLRDASGSLRDAIAAGHAERAALNSELGDLRKQLHALRSSRTAAISQIDTGVGAAIQAAKSSQARAAADADQALRALGEREQEVQALRERCSALEEERDRAVSAVGEEERALQAQLATAREENEALHGSLDAMQGQVASLQARISEYDAVLSSKEAETASARSQLADSQAQAASLQAALDARMQHEGSLQDGGEAGSTSVSPQPAEEEHAHSASDMRLRERVCELKAQLSLAKEDAKVARTALAQSRSPPVSPRKGAAGSPSTIGQLRSKLAAASRSAASYRAELQSVNDRLKTAVMDALNQKKRVERFAEAVRAAKAEASAVRDARANEQSKLLAARERISSLERALAESDAIAAEAASRLKESADAREAAVAVAERKWFTRLRDAEKGRLQAEERAESLQAELRMAGVSATDPAGQQGPRPLPLTSFEMGQSILHVTERAQAAESALASVEAAGQHAGLQASEQNQALQHYVRVCLCVVEALGMEYAGLLKRALELERAAAVSKVEAEVAEKAASLAASSARSISEALSHDAPDLARLTESIQHMVGSINSAASHNHGDVLHAAQSLVPEWYKGAVALHTQEAPPLRAKNADGPFHLGLLKALKAVVRTGVSGERGTPSPFSMLESMVASRALPGETPGDATSAGLEEAVSPPLATPLPPELVTDLTQACFRTLTRVALSRLQFVAGRRLHSGGSGAVSANAVREWFKRLGLVKPSAVIAGNNKRLLHFKTAAMSSADFDVLLASHHSHTLSGDVFHAIVRELGLRLYPAKVMRVAAHHAVLRCSCLRECAQSLPSPVLSLWFLCRFRLGPALQPTLQRVPAHASDTWVFALDAAWDGRGAFEGSEVLQQCRAELKGSAHQLLLTDQPMAQLFDDCEAPSVSSSAAPVACDDQSSGLMSEECDSPQPADCTQEGPAKSPGARLGVNGATHVLHRNQGQLAAIFSHYCHLAARQGQTSTRGVRGAAAAGDGTMPLEMLVQCLHDLNITPGLVAGDVAAQVLGQVFFQGDAALLRVLGRVLGSRSPSKAAHAPLRGIYATEDEFTYLLSVLSCLALGSVALSDIPHLTREQGMEGARYLLQWADLSKGMATVRADRSLSVAPFSIV